jgi:hypothetical protein
MYIFFSLCISTSLGISAGICAMLVHYLSCQRIT